MNIVKSKLIVSVLFSLAVLALIIVVYVQFSSSGKWNNFLAGVYQSSYTTTNSKVNGVCGSANRDYEASEKSYSGNYCDSGKPTTVPPFPLPGKISYWSCQGSNGGSTASCSANHSAKACAVIALGGFNSDGSFASYVTNLTKGYKNIDLRSSSFNFAKEAGSFVKTNVSEINQAHPKTRVLVVAHSISSIGTFNHATGLNMDYLLYDPPYNYPSAYYFMAGIFSSNASQIQTAKNNGIENDPSMISWTGGLDQPDDLTEQQNHEKYKYDANALSKVSTWLSDNCTKI